MPKAGLREVLFSLVPFGSAGLRCIAWYAERPLVDAAWLVRRQHVGSFSGRKTNTRASRCAGHDVNSSWLMQRDEAKKNEAKKAPFQVCIAR
jgi:hypothetical protein